MEVQLEERATKRRRLKSEDDNGQSPHKTLERSISPPPPRNGQKAISSASESSGLGGSVLPSQFQLTSIRDLPASANLDTVSISDILGDPLISECWEFNYLHDIDFLMENFDPDVRDSVKVHVVHGFWKHDDPRRQKIQVKEEPFEYDPLMLFILPCRFMLNYLIL